MSDKITNADSIPKNQYTILRMLYKAGEEPMFGLQFAEKIPQGSVYAELKKLEEKKLVKSKNEVKEKGTFGRPRKYYMITKKGKKLYKEWRALKEGGQD